MIETIPRRIEPARKIAEALRAATSIAISTHLGGDGDGWGSACALAHHFGPLGVDVRLLAASPYPDRFRFLLPSGTGTLPPDEAGIEALSSADIQLVVDASAAGRLGDFASHYDPARTILIDHHPVAGAGIDSALALIDPTAASTTELIYDVLGQSGQPLAPATAQALYVGLVTDTGSFRYSNTSSRTHRLAAELIEAGAAPESLYRPLFANLTPAELGTLRATLERLQRDEKLGVTWAALGGDVAQRYGHLDEYEGIIDQLRNLSGTELAVLFRQLDDGTVKISFRSTGSADVAALARSYGGGGHEKAAGATLRGELEEVTRRVLADVRAAVQSLA